MTAMAATTRSKAEPAPGLVAGSMPAPAPSASRQAPTASTGTCGRSVAGEAPDSARCTVIKYAINAARRAPPPCRGRDGMYDLKPDDRDGRTLLPRRNANEHQEAHPGAHGRAEQVGVLGQRDPGQAQPQRTAGYQNDGQDQQERRPGGVQVRDGRPHCAGRAQQDGGDNGGNPAGTFTTGRVWLVGHRRLPAGMRGRRV